MLKLEFIKKDEYANYVLKDRNGKKYNLNINFMDTEKPVLGTIIYLPEKMVNDNVSLNFGKIESKDGVLEEDLIVLLYDNKKTYLERFYG